MLKNLILFRVQGEIPDIETVRNNLDARAFTGCHPTQQLAVGFVPPRAPGGALLESIDGQWMLKGMVETRTVPSKAIKKLADEMADNIEKQTGRRPKGKRYRELKEEAAHTLLPRAFTKEAASVIWLNPTTGVVAVDATSVQRADLLLTMLNECASGLRLDLLQTARAPALCMSAWLVQQEPPPNFSIDRECELKQPDSEKATVRYARHSLEIDEVSEHIRQGKVPTKVAMTWKGRVSFLLSDELAIRRVEILDSAVVAEGGKAVADAFDTDVVIKTGELSGAIADLIEAMGGLLELPEHVAAAT